MLTDRQPTTGTETATILVSFELSQKDWLITLRQPGSAKLSRHSLPAGDTAALEGLLWRHRQLAQRSHGNDIAIASIQEAGLDGFWLHRWLEQHGVDSQVVDAASIAAPRRKRRAKSDGIDGETLLRVLAAWRRGEPRVCSMVQPASVEIEDQRRLIRERERLLSERVALTNRIGGLLLGQGVRGYQPLRADRHAVLATLRTGDGRDLPRRLHDEISRMLERIELLQRQIAAIEAEREALLRQAGAGSAPALLLDLRGIGPGFASVLWLECFWRSFASRRQVASFGGLSPTPWRSGGIVREQGVSGGGQPRLRHTMIELAWLWLSHQPTSALSQWFRARTAQASKRDRRIAIVALARKLLVALWRYVSDGVVPEGAITKAAGDGAR
jgi:transposase